MFSNKRLLSIAVGLLAMVFAGRSASVTDPTDPVAAAQKGLDWISAALPQWLPENNTNRFDCLACHTPGAALLGASRAASRGFEVEPDTLQTIFDKLSEARFNSGPDAGAIGQFGLMGPPRQAGDPSYTPIATTSRAVTGLVPYLFLLEDPSAAALLPHNDPVSKADLLTMMDGIADWTLPRQAPDGHWPTHSVDLPHPSDMPDTASLAIFLAFWRSRDSERAAAIDRAISRAADWLVTAKPPGDYQYSDRDFALRLLALVSTGRAADATRAAADLISRQAPWSGGGAGWRDGPKRPLGAWATGMAVVALRQADPVRYGPAIEAGIRFLLAPGQQKPNGHWESMTTWSQTEAQNGFDGAPKDNTGQFVTALEPTAWAVAALASIAKPPCDPVIRAIGFTGTPVVRAGPGHTVQFEVSRAACIGDTVWSIHPIPDLNGADVGVIDPETGLYRAPEDLASPLDLEVRWTIAGESNATRSLTMRVLPRIRLTLTTFPNPAETILGGTVRIMPRITGEIGVDSRVTWSPVRFGALDTDGLYTAPTTGATPASVAVVATSVADPTVQATVEIRVAAPTVRITEPSATPLPMLFPGDALQFRGRVENAMWKEIEWTVEGYGGSIDRNGLFTVDPLLARPSVVTVRAAAKADTTKFDIRYVPVYPKIRISISPNTADGSPLRILQNTDREFSATVVNSPSDPPKVLWTFLDTRIGTNEMVVGEGARQTIHTPSVTEDTLFTLIATSGDDPRVSARVPLLVLAKNAFLGVEEKKVFAGETVEILVRALVLDGSVKGGVVTLVTNAIDLQPEEVVFDPRVSVTEDSLAVSTTNGRLNATVAFQSEPFTGVGEIYHLQVKVPPSISPGVYSLDLRADLEAAGGGAITTVTGNAKLTILAPVTTLGVYDATAVAGETVLSNLYIDRALHASTGASTGVIGILVDRHDGLPSLYVPDALTALNGPSLPPETTFVLLPRHPDDIARVFEYFFSAPVEVMGPGVLFALPIRVSNTAVKGSVYTLQPVLDTSDRSTDRIIRPGSITVIDPKVWFENQPSFVRAGETVELTVHTEDVPDEDVGWKILSDENVANWETHPSGPGSIEGTGFTVMYRAPSSIPPRGAVYVRAFSRRYPGRAFDVHRLAIRPSLRLTMNPSTPAVAVGGMVSLSAVPSEAGVRVSWGLLPGPDGWIGGQIIPTGDNTVSYQAPEQIDGTPKEVTIRAVIEGFPGSAVTRRVTIGPLSLSLPSSSATIGNGETHVVHPLISGGTTGAVSWESLDGAPSTLWRPEPNGNLTITAPSSITAPARYRFRAASREDPTRTVIFEALLQPAGRLSVAPLKARVRTGETLPLILSFANISPQPVVWSIEPNLGSVVSDRTDPSKATYTAPASLAGNQATVTVTASLPGPTSTSASALITLADVSLDVIPTTPVVSLGGEQRFMAMVTGAIDDGVVWTVDGPGSIDATGLYRAPDHLAGTPAEVRITAASREDPRRKKAVTVTLGKVAVRVEPSTMTVKPGDTVTLVAFVDGATDQKVSWRIEGEIAGSLTVDGRYTAPTSMPATRSVVVRAVSIADPDKGASVTIRIEPALAISIDPPGTTLNLGETARFTASVSGAETTGVVWTLDGPGTLHDGRYTAPETGTTPMSVRIRAASILDETVYKEVTVAIRKVGLSISPSEIDLRAGETASFIAAILNSTNRSVEWKIGAGSSTAVVSEDGTVIVSPDTVVGTVFQVEATSAADRSVTASARVQVVETPSQIALTPWPMDRHDIHRTGRSEGAGPAAAPSLLWSQPDSESEISTPSIDPSGRIYVGTRVRSMISLEPDGRVRWSLAQTIADNGWMRSSPAVRRDGVLYLVSPGNVLFAVHPDGSEKWRVGLEQPSEAKGVGTPSSPLLAPDGTIYVGLSREVIAVNADGSLRWRTTLAPGGSEILASPAIGPDGRIFIGAGDGAFYALDPASGSRTLIAQTFGGIDVTAAVDPIRKRIVFGSQDGTLYCIDETGRILSATPLGGPIRAPAAIDSDGGIYIPDPNGRLIAIHDGRIAWTVEFQSPMEGPVVVDRDGRIYGVTRSGEAFAVDRTGQTIWRMTLPAPPASGPIIGGDGLLLVSIKGRGLTALGGTTTPVAGDITHNGWLEIGDVILALRIAAGTAALSPDRLAAGDVSPRPGTDGRPYGDGRITLADVTELLRRVLRIERDPWP